MERGFNIPYHKHCNIKDANKHITTGVYTYITMNDNYSKFGNAGLKSEILKLTQKL
jgi:hypothetical protein